MKSLDMKAAPAAAAAALEIVTGAGLVVAPSLLARLLFGSEMGGTGDIVGRIAGLVMICLAAACWPRGPEGARQALAPLLALSWLAAAYLLVVGASGANVGPLLWPAFLAHLVLGVLLGRVWFTSRG